MAAGSFLHTALFSNCRSTEHNSRYSGRLWEQHTALDTSIRPAGRGPAECACAGAVRSHPVPTRTEGHAERSQGPVSAPHGQQQRPGFRFMACLPQVPGQLLRVPAPLLGASQEVLDDVRVEGSGDALHQQLGVQEQGKEFLVTIRVIHLQETRQARRESGAAYFPPADAS